MAISIWDMRISPCSVSYTHLDDDCLVAGALKTILEVNEDVEVLATGADGKEACELYERYEPDVLLMDIRMEKMDGLEASRSILSR